MGQLSGQQQCIGLRLRGVGCCRHELRPVAAGGQRDHQRAARLGAVVLAQTQAQAARLDAHDAVAARVEAVGRTPKNRNAEQRFLQLVATPVQRVQHQVAQQALVGQRTRGGGGVGVEAAAMA